MKKNLTLLAALMVGLPMYAQTDVTATYLQNADFSARYAGWLNEGGTKGNVGGFQHQTNSSFTLKKGEIYMEKYVGAGGKVGNCNIQQRLVNLPVGTYMLTAAAQNHQGGNGEGQTGAWLYAADQQAEVGAVADYSVTFTCLTGQTVVGFKTQAATGNHVCVDNFRLTLLDTDMTAIHAELQRLIDEATAVLGEGNTAAELQAAIVQAQALLGATTADGVQEAAIALQRATTNYIISNGTGNAPIVTTEPFVVMGTTIALGRSTIKNNGATLKESGFCWSTQPEPTVLDDRTTEYFNNNGKIYRMEQLEPATIYYVRAYAWSTDNQVGYGDVVKIATKPMGGVSYVYDFAGDAEINARINSSIAETVWMYNNVSNIHGIQLNVHYASGTPTADCSYGGWMRVGPTHSYQQTGTLLHETNHGVGVGTHWVWYDNASLRENKTHGKWLGPHATEVVQFLQNDAKAFMQGDGTHMWGGSASGKNVKNYGINGAHEDSYSPADQLLYWGNILLTHALHIDGLPCSNSVGFATPAYVFEQYDGQKYYLKSEVDEYGRSTFLGHTKTGNLRNIEATMEDALSNDSLAWYITYNPKTCYYTFQNVGSGRYLGLSSDAIKATTTASPMHLFPSREKITKGDFTAHSYWITNGKGKYALKVGSTSCSTVGYDNAATADAQRWLFLTAEDVKSYDDEIKATHVKDLKALVKNIQTLMETEHVAKNAETDVADIDASLQTLLTDIEGKLDNDGYSSSVAVINEIEVLNDALVTFLTACNPAGAAAPFDVTFLIQNAGITSNEGWSEAPTYDKSLVEYFTTQKFDFNQTIPLKMPNGTYKLMAQAFQRPGAYADVYADYMAGTDNVKAMLYLKTTKVPVKNIMAERYKSTLGTGCVKMEDGTYIPNTMANAAAFFRNDMFENEVLVTTTIPATMKLGITCPAVSTNYWTCIDNFRLYYYGNIDKETVTPVQGITAEAGADAPMYDLSGRRIAKPATGLYIQGGKKIIVND